LRKINKGRSPDRTHDSPSHSKTNRHLSIRGDALVLCRTRPNLDKTLQRSDLGLEKLTQEGRSTLVEKKESRAIA